MPVLTVVFGVLLIVASIRSQCTVSSPNIASSSDLCAVVSQESLSYSCTNDNLLLTWASSVWSGPLIVSATETAVPPDLNVDGVTLMENDNDNETCLTSTITFIGNISALSQLNGSNLTCRQGIDQDDTFILLPFLPGSSTLMSTQSAACGSDGNQVTLQWTPPTNTGGQGVMIDRYLLTVSGPAGYTCPPDQCNVTTTSTTLTGLQCNTSYNVSVRAVNCRGAGDASNPIMIMVDELEPLVPSFQEAPCFDGNNIRVPLMTYTNSCLSNTMFVVSSNCSDNELVVMVSQTVNMLSVSDTDYCEVTVLVRSDCGESLSTTMMVNGTCPMIPMLTPTPTSAPSPDPGPPLIIIIIIVCVIGVIAAALVILLIIILVCIFCPCGFCMSCRRKCCCCCSEDMICYKCCADDEYSEPTPLQEKQPVLQSFSTETKEKDVETGQPSYPSSAGPMYQDPNTIQRTAAPTTGDLYAQPEKPARHQKQKPPPPPMEMATYQDPNTIQRTAAPTTGDLYAQPDKPPKQPSGPAPVYSEVNKSNPGGLVYADLAHPSGSPANVRRPEQVPDTVYSEVSRH